MILLISISHNAKGFESPGALFGSPAIGRLLGTSRSPA